MKIYNTLTGKIEEIKPISDKNIGYYTCGPTVYDNAHIGNLRTYIFEDSIKRVLEASGFKVKHVMNITDVDDKTIRKGDGQKEKFEALTKEYEARFWSDMDELHNKRPDVVTRATEYISAMVKFVEALEEKSFAYRGSDGSIYFSIAKFPDYGKLSHLDMANLKSGARVAQDEYDKENPADFALWKAWDKSDGEIYWETSLGKGRPGWHIECSAMATSVLGETIDIHTGGVDNIFPHHENEIAQSEARSGKKFVNYWVHGEHLLVDGHKMSKSLNNFYTLDSIKEKGYSPLDFRYLVLQAHYRSKLNFTWDGLEAAKNARIRLERIMDGLRSVSGGSINQNYSGQFNLKMSNDLDTPGALATVWELVRDDQVKPEDKHATLLEMDQILGLGLEPKLEGVELTSEQNNLIKLREEARAAGEWEKSDKIRRELAGLGIMLEDTKEGTKVQVIHDKKEPKLLTN